jgi:hypothetical protein
MFSFLLLLLFFFFVVLLLQIHEAYIAHILFFLGETSAGEAGGGQ